MPDPRDVELLIAQASAAQSLAGPLALERFNEALNLDPRHMSAINGVITELSKFGRQEEVIAFLDDRISYFSGREDIANLLSKKISSLLALHKIGDAETLIETMLRNYADIFFSYVAACGLYRHTHNEERLIEVLANGISQLPKGNHEILRSRNGQEQRRFSRPTLLALIMLRLQ